MKFPLIDRIRAFWNHGCYGQFGEEIPDKTTSLKENYPRFEISNFREDRDFPNLFVGKIIKDDFLRCEVIDYSNNNMRVKVLEIKYDRMKAYLDIGDVYCLFKYSYSNAKEQTWQIVHKPHMKNNIREILLYWENGLGWTWDLMPYDNK